MPAHPFRHTHLSGRARGRARSTTIALGAILAALSWASLGAGSAYATGTVTVMTQNIYQGTEFAHFAALQAIPEPTFEQALGATTADYGTYVATRFKDRAKLIAASIAQNKPALVGLQEVATWHAGAFNPSHPFALPVPVTEDFTDELLKALASDGLKYEVASRRDGNFTLAFPILTPSFTCCVAVGMVESGEILARKGLPPGQLTLSNPQSGAYATHIPPIPNPLVPSEPFEFGNSWQSIDVVSRGTRFRFITTHLDALAPGGVISGPQAKELLAGPANTTLPVVVTGDMNSGPTSAPAAYKAFVEGGLTDTWSAAGLGAPPLTCCRLGANDLVNEPSSKYTEDLDHVFARGGFRVRNTHLVGDVAPNPPPEPFIWASDHAGMVATLALPDE
jgi:endonuclease/exonuclease/phosphatase family metal-dependent hydrolase